MFYGEKLLNFRAKNNLSQEKLSLILGVSINMIHRYEKGLNEPSQMRKVRYGNKMKEWEERKNV